MHAMQVNMLSELLKGHGGSELTHLQTEGMGGQHQQQQLVDALATLLLSNGYVQQELPEAQVRKSTTCIFLELLRK